MTISFVPGMFVWQVIGVRGANVRAIRSQSGANVDIETQGIGSTDSYRQISLSGEAAQVAAAEHLIW